MIHITYTHINTHIHTHTCARIYTHFPASQVGMMRVKSERKEDWTRLQKLATGKQSYLAIRHAREALNDTEWSMRVVVSPPGITFC